VVTLARRELVARAGEAGSVRELFGVASERLRRLVPHDAAVWLATDPATNLPTAPTRAENMERFGGRADCARLWELEFLFEDVNLYRDLARAESPAAGLRLATEDRPARSPRFRDVLRPNGFGDELRAVLRVDGSPWASVTLFRAEGAPPFDERDTTLLAGLSRPLGEAVRDHSRPQVAPAVTGDPGPGLMVFDAAGELMSINDDAYAWLDEVAGDLAGDDGFGVRLPLVVVSTLIRARAIAEERAHGSARARMRSSATGRWLVCHASCLRDAEGRIGSTALVIEPAKASEVAPIITEAYDLSPRERQITQLIARGAGTANIAAGLHLSAHTVRDYVKAIFEKVGVSSRGELVARLFAEHYAPIHLASGEHDAVRRVTSS
jgi:DNA-binding CsgD family transcriptional regulator